MVLEAERLLASGRLDEAAQVAHAVLAGTPQTALALNVLGIVAAKHGQSEAAFALWQMATRVGPTVAQPWVSLGEALFHLNRPLEAAEAFREALSRQPDLSDVLVNRGIALQHGGQNEEALDPLRRGIAANPRNIEARISLASALFSLRRTDQAIEVLELASQAAPDNAKVWSNLGVLHEKTERFERAVGYYDRALAIAPHDAKTLFNRGSSLIHLLRVDEARRDWNASLGLDPRDATTANNLAILELLDGNLPLGFELFEARWGVRHQRFPIPAPEWDGSSLDGRHILLYVEQGLGDMLQFCRYVPILKSMFRCRVTLCAPLALRELLRSLEGLDEVVDIHPPYPRCDVQCSLLSIPRLLKTSIATVPAGGAYLRADSGRIARWKERLAMGPGGPKVGLFWQGTQVDPNRTIRLSELAPLWKAEGVRFVSLQKGPGEEEMNGFGLPILRVGHELMDFADTAAVLANLDLLVTIDTAIAHAAGALGCPVWTLVPYRPDWRWMLGRSDSPWYPTMRLYRQAQRKDWSAPLGEIARDLAGVR